MKIRHEIQTSRQRAFTARDMVILIGTGMVLLGILILPALARAKAKAVGINCQNNLKQVALAFRIWAGDHGDRYPMESSSPEFDGPKFANGPDMFRYFQVMSNEFSSPKIVNCPGDAERNPATNFGAGFGNGTISYFIGVDARETNANSFLAGDRMLSNGQPLDHGRMGLTANQKLSWTKRMHESKGGNIVLPEGDVLRRLQSSDLRGAAARTGLATNWLVFP